MIITNEDQLIVPCKKASLLESAAVIKRLEEELKGSSPVGVGLAANQIGIDAAIAIIRMSEKYSWDLINPEIVEKDDLVLCHNEGCLSFPKQRISTVRYNEIVVKSDNYPNGLMLWGVPAIVAQHEIDHLFGVIMKNRRIEPPKPNDKCFCNSGKKYKRCHEGKEIIL